MAVIARERKRERKREREREREREKIKLIHNSYVTLIGSNAS